jgi:hypothetical protein
MRSILFFVGRLSCEMMSGVCVPCALLDYRVCAALYLHLRIWEVLGPGIRRHGTAFVRCDDIIMCSVAVVLTGEPCWPVHFRVRAFEKR